MLEHSQGHGTEGIVIKTQDSLGVLEQPDAFVGQSLVAANPGEKGATHQSFKPLHLLRYGRLTPEDLVSRCSEVFVLGYGCEATQQADI